MDWDDYAPGLAAAMEKLGQVDPISNLDDLPDVIKPDERRQIIGQAEFGLQSIYAHLPLKRVRHALDPFRALNLLSHRVDAISDREFHSEMMSVFKALGDIHTSYRPPPPHDRMIAFLPFLVERYFEKKQPKYLVTRILDGFSHSTFKPGAEIVSWRGMPIERAIETNSAATAGANVGTELALAVHFLTIRWLGFSLPPREYWVDIGYSTGSDTHEIRLPWALLTMDPNLPDFQLAEQAVVALSKPGEAALNTGLNAHTHVEQLARRRLFAPAKVQETESLHAENETALKRLRQGKHESEGPSADGSIRSLIPEIFEAAVVTQGAAQFGYLRIRSFMRQADDFVHEFRRLIDLMPKRGLIIDIRGNPGGIIQAAERVLQFITPQEVDPLGFQFISTAVTQQLTHPPDDVDPEIRRDRAGLGKLWGASINLALDTGATYSKTAPLTLPAHANDAGQRYYGPVVLITDSMTYSSGDMFAAGFQDVDIGPVLGVDFTTGAGGANVWSHTHLASMLPDVEEFAPLSGGVQITYAARRCLRGGPFSGLPIEELGVHSDPPRYFMTRRDILHENEDLLKRAAQLLSKLPSRELDVELKTESGQATMNVASVGIDRLDVYVDDRPHSSVDVPKKGSVEVILDLSQKGPHKIAAQGFQEGRLVASWRGELSSK